MSEPASYRLTALRGRPNRVLPIGTIADGKREGEPNLVHVHTGSTRIVPASDVPALREHLEREGIADDYQLEPLVRTLRAARRRGQFAPPEQADRSPSGGSRSGRAKSRSKGAEAEGSGG